MSVRKPSQPRGSVSANAIRQKLNDLRRLRRAPDNLLLHLVWIAIGHTAHLAFCAHCRRFLSPSRGSMRPSREIKKKQPLHFLQQLRRLSVILCSYFFASVSPQQPDIRPSNTAAFLPATAYRSLRICGHSSSRRP